MECRHSREIAPYLMDDLSASQRRALRQHLRQCDVCRREKESLQETFAALESLEDVPVPHHFFVPQDEARLSLLQAWGRLSSLGRALVALAALLLLTVAGLAAGGFRLQVTDGVLTAGFGSAPPSSLSEERLQDWSSQLLTQVDENLAFRDRALTEALARVRLLEHRLSQSEQARQRSLQSLAADLEEELSLAWKVDDQQSLRQVEHWINQAYGDLRRDYLRRLAVVDSNMQQFVERDAVLGERVSFLGEALAQSMDRRSPQKTGE
ncbi:MAG TPA: zf-HC2 domain-containing protein [Acidobacteriota bacterium]|nr:zf-HC2 domain-containing protein [Acidobacteriota bacterium]